MFGLFARRKAAEVAECAAAAVRDTSARARRERLFDRTVMTPDVVPPEMPLLRLHFGLKQVDD